MFQNVLDLIKCVGGDEMEVQLKQTDLTLIELMLLKRLRIVQEKRMINFIIS